MQLRIRPLLWASIAGLILLAVCGGCTKAARKNRYLSQAGRDFAAGQYDKAEIEYLKALRVAPADPAALSLLGVLYHDEGRFPQAYVYLKKALQLVPTNTAERVKFCLTEYAVGDFKGAHDDAERVLKEQPGQEDALLVLAELAFNMKEAQDAAQRIHEMRQQDQDRPSYHLALATLYFRQALMTNVTAEVNQALALDPKHPATLNFLGNLFWMSNNLSRADAAFKSAAELSAVRSARRVRYADFKTKTGSPQEAKAILEDITHNAPDYLPAWASLAQLALSEDKLDDCSACLQRVLARDPMNYQASLLDANSKLKKNQVPQALEILLRLSKLYVHSADVQLSLGRCYLLSGEDIKGEAAIKQAIALDPTSSDAIIALAELDFRKGDYASTVSSLEKLLAWRKDLPQAYILLGAAYVAQKNPDQALPVYHRMQLEFPKSPEVPMLIAALHASQNNPAEARKACAQALELAPDYLPPLEELVNLDLADKQSKAALDRVAREIERRPKVPELRLLAAKVQIGQKDYPQAEISLLKAIEIAPNLRTPYLLLSQLYMASNKPQQALDKLKSFVAKTNDVTVLVEIGDIYDTIKDYPAARDAYEKVLAVNPSVPMVLNNLAYLYCERFNQVDKALSYAEQAQRSNPNDPSVTDTLGWVLYHKAEYPKALPLIARAAAAAPNEPEIQYHLGMINYALGQEGPARQAFSRAIESQRDFPWKEDARNRLLILAMDPNSPDPSNQPLLEKRVAQEPGDPVAEGRLAGIFRRNGAPDKAIKAFEVALSRDPRNTYLLTNLASLYSDSSSGASRDPQKALQYAKDAHTAAPDDPNISAIFGHFLLDSADFKWASTLLTEASLALPSRRDVLYDLAQAYYGLGRLDSAEITVQNALKGSAVLDQNDEAKRFLTFLQAYHDPAQRQIIGSQLDGVLKTNANYVPALMIAQLDQQGRGAYADAKKTLDKVLAINALFVPAARDLAILCFSHFPDDPRISDLAGKARAVYPEDTNLARVLGVMAYRNGDYLAASRFLKQSLQDHQNDADLLYYLGMADYQLKARADSKACLQKALSLNLQAKYTEEAKRVLAELK